MSSLPPETEGPRKRKGPIVLAAVFALAVLGVVADVAQLAVFPTPAARALLLAVALTGLLYLVVKVWQLYFVEKVRELRARLEREAEEFTLVRSAHQRCLEAIERISERERPLFTETLEVTVRIGDDDGSDLIVERRVTTPAPLVTNRTMRPIVPVHSDQIASIGAIGFTVHREIGEITFIPLREQINKLKVWLVFDPPMSARTEWRVEYRPKGLWRPFRQRGFDELRWDDRLRAANGKPSAFSDFKVIFEFPAGGSAPSVVEQSNYGHVMKPKQRADRTWEITWHDDRPAGHYYVWEFAQPRIH